MDLRYWLYRQKYLNARWLRHTTPVDVSLELSSFCNLSCVYCYQSDDKPPFQKASMPYDLAELVLEQAAQMGVNSVKFNFRGEATLNKDFCAILNLAKSLANKSTFIDRILNTNFNFPNNRYEYFDALSSLTKVKVSCDSFSPGVLEAQRIGCNAELVYRNIHTFYHWKRRQETGTRLVIQAVRTQKNKDENFHAYVSRRWPDTELSIRDMVSGRASTEQQDLEVKKRYALGRQSCIQAHARMIVFADGKVSPCCPAFKGDLIIGDANKTPLKEIFNSYQAKQLRTDLRTGAAFANEPCKSCPSFESYSGYRAPKDS